jgi:L-ribulose-5-phosphate 4-epimerase
MMTELRDEVRALQAEVCALHHELVRWGLVTWTSGNVSARLPGADVMVIKPSGVPYDELTPGGMALTDLHGQPLDGPYAPSSDTLSHAYIYRSLPSINGVAHTHSPYATAWAARRESIPCVLTAMADEFGGEIPLAGGPSGRPWGVHDRDDGPSRGQGRRDVRGRRADGPLPRQLGEPIAIESADVDRLYARYQNGYGQTPAKGSVE